MPTLIDTIVCENIRQEANNKLSLLGVFGDEVLVPHFPHQFQSLAFFQRWSLAEDEYRRGTVTCRIEIRPPQGEPIILADNHIPLNPAAAHSVTIGIQLGGLSIQSEGTLLIATFFDNQELHVHRFAIRIPSRNEVEQLHLTGF